jgi:hypothetical protein
MAIVLLATQEIFERLNGYTNGVSMIEFVKDKNGDWVISSDVLEDYAFNDIKVELMKLPKIAYEPINA